MSAVLDVARPPALPVRQVAAVFVGNALEFYDFITYAIFATSIGHAFFPTGSAASSLMLSLGTFGIGFFTRPLGGVVIGIMGDRLGRKPAMLLSFMLMGIAIVGLALTPTYGAIGVAAPILAVGFRMLQGFALGGEVGPTTAWMIEAAPPARRGFYGSLQYATQDASVLAGGLVGVGLTAIMQPVALDAWGWRIAFLLGAAVVPAGLWIRRSLPETLDAPEPEAAPAHHPATARTAVLGLLMLGSGTICAYVMLYMTSYATVTLHMAGNLAFGATVVVGLAGVSFDWVSGLLADRFGRKPVMMLPWLLLLLAIYPAFLAISTFRSAGTLLGATGVLATLFSLSTPTVLVTITEALPRRIRSGALAVIYALAISTFGGTTQLMVTWLIDLTGNPMAPAWYMAAATAVGLVAMGFMPETAPGRAGRS